MKIFRLAPEEFKESYGGLYNEIQPSENPPESPFFSSFFVVKPGVMTKHHMHHESESFVCLRGQGLVLSGASEQRVVPGDVVYFPPFHHHCFYNDSSTEDLLLMSIFWVERENIKSALPPATQIPGQATLFCAPPTPNGDLHLGHLSGPLLAADVLGRHLKRQGKLVRSISGTDSHLSFVTLKALQNDDPCEEIAERATQQIEISLKEAAISFDRFLSFHREPLFQKTVQDAFLELYTSGHLCLKEQQCFFSASGEYLPNALVRGHCPHCGSPCVAGECEACGTPNDGWDLVEPTSAIDGTTPRMEALKRFVFPLERHRENLRRFVNLTPLPLRATALYHTILARPLPDFPLTYPGTAPSAGDSTSSAWGIEAPVSEVSGHIINPYFEWIVACLTLGGSFSGPSSQEWKRMWTDPQHEKIFCLGFDNIFDHLVLQPAVLGALFPEIQLSSRYVVNDFLQLEGEKFSTSRGHSIEVSNFVQSSNREALKLYLSFIRAERHESNFTIKEFNSFSHSFFNGLLGGLCESLCEQICTRFQGISPYPGAWRTEDRHFYDSLHAARVRYLSAFSSPEVSLRDAAHTVVTLAQKTEQYFKDARTLAGIDSLADEFRTKIALTLTSIGLICSMLYPITPESAARVWSFFGFPGELAHTPLNVELVIPVAEQQSVKQGRPIGFTSVALPQEAP